MKFTNFLKTRNRCIIIAKRNGKKRGNTRKTVIFFFGILKSLQRLNEIKKKLNNQ